MLSRGVVGVNLNFRHQLSTGRTYRQSDKPVLQLYRQIFAVVTRPLETHKRDTRESTVTVHPASTSLIDMVISRRFHIRPGAKKTPFRHPWETVGVFVKRCRGRWEGCASSRRSGRTAIVSRCFCIAGLPSFHLGARISRKELWLAVSEWNLHLFFASSRGRRRPPRSLLVFQQLADGTEITSEGETVKDAAQPWI